MKTAEILRNLLDLIAQEEQAEQAQTQPVVININNGEVEQETADAGETQDDNVGVFVPPLQQKIEMHKKAHGLDNIYDQAAEEDEIVALKKNAGIAVLDAEEDEPFEG